MKLPKFLNNVFGTKVKEERKPARMKTPDGWKDFDVVVGNAKARRLKNGKDKVK